MAVAESGVIKAAVAMGHASHGGWHGVAMVLFPHIVAVSFQEGELGIIEDVIVSATQTMLGGTNQEVPVVFPTLPPHGQVETGLTQLKSLSQQRVAKHLLPNLPQQLDAVERAGGSLFSDWFHKQRVVNWA